MIKMGEGVAPQGWFWDESRWQQWDSALLALLSSDCWDEADREVSMQLPLPREDFQPSVSSGKKKRETAARVCLGLSSFLPKNIKTRSLNSERFRDQCRNNLGKNKSNEIKFSTSVWYLLLSECQNPTRLTHMNISTDWQQGALSSCLPEKEHIQRN